MQKIEEWDRQKIKKVVYMVITLVVIYCFFKWHIFSYMLPFLIAYMFAMLLNPFVSWLNARFRMPRGVGTILSMVTILSGVLTLISVIIKQLWDQIVTFAGAFPMQSEQLVNTISELQEKWAMALNILPASEAFNNLDTAIDKLLAGVGSFFKAAIPGVYSMISRVPDIVIFIIVMLIATFFMTKDYAYIKEFIKAQIPEAVTDKVCIMQRGLLGALGGYIRTQLILMGITFGICLVGLFLLRVDLALLISVIIAIVDALPVFGSGTILIPWAIYNIIVGNYILAVGLLCIYGIIFVTRQIMEPKILSTQIGVYALITVMSMYVGYKAIGVFGLIVGPIIAVCIKTLQAVGVLPDFKPVKEQTNKEKLRENNPFK